MILPITIKVQVWFFLNYQRNNEKLIGSVLITFMQPWLSGWYEINNLNFLRELSKCYLCFLTSLLAELISHPSATHTALKMSLLRLPCPTVWVQWLLSFLTSPLCLMAFMFRTLSSLSFLDALPPDSFRFSFSVFNVGSFSSVHLSRVHSPMIQSQALVSDISWARWARLQLPYPTITTISVEFSSLKCWLPIRLLILVYASDNSNLT